MKIVVLMLVSIMMICSNLYAYSAGENKHIEGYLMKNMPLIVCPELGHNNNVYYKKGK